MKETPSASPIEEPKYWVDVKPVIRRTEYTVNDYLIYHATLFLGDEEIVSEDFHDNNRDIYPGQYREDEIEDWARRKMMVDKGKRGLIEPYTIDLETEDD